MTIDYKNLRIDRDCPVKSGNHGHLLGNYGHLSSNASRLYYISIKYQMSWLNKKKKMIVAYEKRVFDQVIDQVIDIRLSRKTEQSRGLCIACTAT